jgi:hypothetical protein
MGLFPQKIRINLTHLLVLLILITSHFFEINSFEKRVASYTPSDQLISWAEIIGEGGEGEKFEDLFFASFQLRFFFFDFALFSICLINFLFCRRKLSFLELDIPPPTLV